MATPLELSPHASPNKRVKTLDAPLCPPPQSPPSPASRGKSKIQEVISSSSSSSSHPIQKEVENIESNHCCGICLSEAGNGGGVSRGYIDSCNHFFCFVCIMEWAKVESKCPLCKRRFSSIRRPPKPPIFASERVVQVPVRNQVYHYSGNASIGPPDPYSEVKCSVCHDVADESLILLCDLCDAASHTYCVGLGATVPEGDWFCPDCTLLRDEHLKSETNTDSAIQTSFDTVHELPSATEHVSIFDIVREPCAPVFQRSRRASEDPCYLPPPSSVADGTSMIKNIGGPSSTSFKMATQHPTKQNARTLRRCRNVQDRIRVIREKWNEFRSGTWQFSSSPGNGNISSQKSVTCKRGRHSVSRLNLQSKHQRDSSDIPNVMKARDIHRAWKMMDKAMSIKQGCQRSTSVRQTSECLLRKVDTLKNAENMSYRHLPPDSLRNGSKNVRSMGTRNQFLENSYYKQAYSVSAKQKWRRHMTKDVTSCFEGLINTHSPTHHELESSKDVQTSLYLFNASVRNEKLLAEKTFKEPACLGPSVVSEPVLLNVDHVKGVSHTSSPHSKVKHRKEKSELEKIGIDSQQHSDAKSEIQSLVKLNLKLQTKEEKLEFDAFKEVARLATHSILAACGLEHPKPGSCSIPGFICSHPNEVRLLQKSSLMPNCCRECFYVFVKDMVNTVLLQIKRTKKKT